MTPEEIRAQALRELAEEQRRSAIAAEKARILARKSWKQRIAAFLPFTITWKKSP